MSRQETTVVSVISTYTLKMNFKNNSVTLTYDPEPFINDRERDVLDKNLEHIKRRIEWCVRKSAGQDVDIEDYNGYLDTNT